MAHKVLVFSLTALDLCCRQPLASEWFDSGFAVPDDGSWGVLRHEQDGLVYILDSEALTSSVRIVINLQNSGYFDRLNPSGRLQSLQRMHFVANTVRHPRRWFPENWSQYVATNLLSIFAYPVSVGRERLIVNMKRSEGDVFFCAVTSKDEQIELESYSPDSTNYNLGIAGFDSVAQQIQVALQNLSLPVNDGVFDLDEVAHGAVSAGLTYSTWLPRLSDQQRSFVNAMPNRSQKLRGPAGTGKTLAMAMKVLRECYRAQDEGQAVRILYVTHSWGVAEQVQTILSQLDERGVTNQVDVFPLITLAQFHLDYSKVNILGDDSYRGKEAQLKALADLVSKSLRGNWNAYESSTSRLFAQRVSAQPGSAEANRFLWDLMLEFACVISANGILPGFNSDKRYKQIERRPWMMPLKNDSEKEFIFNLYTDFITDLTGRDELTTDQVISDHLNMLSTFMWFSKRQREGYDMIFVDEFHLFNEQERMVFHNLTKNPNSHPVIFMAMDPRQSPSETYADFTAPGISQNGNGESEQTLGDFGSIDLNIVYRYTQQILKFLQIIDRFFPTLDLGADWNISVNEAETERSVGQKPQLLFLDSEKEEKEAAIKDALDLASQGQSVAVLCLDSASFSDYKDYVQSNYSNRFENIESRDDVASLRYKKRSIVLSQPHYVAGLQFDAVVIGGFRTTFKQYDPNQSYSLRRFLSDVYLGASRARDFLHIFSSGNKSDFPNALQAAVDENVIDLMA